MSASSTREIILEGYMPPGRDKFYHHLPFDMPSGVERLNVRYEYSGEISGDPRATGGNTVDIGIFDPRGIAFQTAGFRGWSGSARRGFFLAPDGATPGYLPGPLSPGTWHICLGFYKIGPEGCRYRVFVELSSGGNQNPAERPVSPMVDDLAVRPPAGVEGWFRGDLHCHTDHSDGQPTLAEVIDASSARGLDFLAITDHNTMSHLVELSAWAIDGLVLIPGYEVTTYHGHWNVWGSDRWFDFRVGSAEEMARVMKRAADHGCLISCNHPRPFGPPWAFGSEAANFHCIEVWNGSWRLAERGAARYANIACLQFWEDRLKKGRRYVAVGGSDTHSLTSKKPTRLGTPTTWVHCPSQPTWRNLLDGLRAGRVFISRSPDGPQLYLCSEDGHMGESIRRPADNRLAVRLRAVDGKGLALELRTADGCVRRRMVDSDDQDLELVAEVHTSPYIRAQLVDPEADPLVVHALTNPIYLT